MSSNLSQIPLSFPVVPSMTREDFLVSDCNREAMAWIERWPNWNAPALYIYGPEGSGKTHLANILGAKAGSHCQIIESVDASIGNRPMEETLFHLYNRVRQVEGSLLLTGTKPLALLGFAVPDLASRLKSCPQVALGLPDENLLRALLVKLFSDRQMRIDVGLIEYAIPRMERSFAAASNLVSNLDRISMATKKPITSATVRSLLDADQEIFAFD